MAHKWNRDRVRWGGKSRNEDIRSEEHMSESTNTETAEKELAVFRSNVEEN